MSNDTIFNAKEEFERLSTACEVLQSKIQSTKYQDSSVVQAVEDFCTIYFQYQRELQCAFSRISDMNTLITSFHSDGAQRFIQNRNVLQVEATNILKTLKTAHLLYNVLLCTHEAPRKKKKPYSTEDNFKKAQNIHHELQCLFPHFTLWLSHFSNPNSGVWLPLHVFSPRNLVRP